MNEKVLITAAVIGAVGIAAYFIVSAVNAPTEQTGTCDFSNWYDYVNPVCLFSNLDAKVSNATNTVTNELNTVLIIVGVVVVLVIGLLAFGPSTEHIARGAAAFV